MIKSSIFWKIYLSLIFFVVLTSTVVGIFITYEIEQDELRQSRQRLTSYANLFNDTPPEQLKEFSPALRRQVAELNKKLNVRLTVIKPDGSVVADSDEEPAKMENHGTRPEIIEARENGLGVSTRYSNTLKKNMMYVAVPILSDGVNIGYSRAAFSLSDIDERLLKLRNIGLAAMLIGAVIALFFGWFLARRIVFPLRMMTDLANSVADGDYKRRAVIKSKDELGSLARAFNTMAARIMDDIAERENAERKIKQAHDDLELRVKERTSELTRANAQLNQSQQMLQLVMDTIPQAIWWKNRDSVYLGANRFLANLAGFAQPENMIGLTDYDMLWTKEEADFFRECDRRVVESGVAELNIIEPQLQADGRSAWLNTNKVPLRDADGEVVGVLGTFADITEQRRADSALRESEYKLRTLVESMSEGLLQVNNDEVIEFANDRFCEMTGYERGELLGKATLDILFDNDGRKFVDEVNHQRLKGVSSHYELRLKKKSGELMDVIVGGAPFVNAEGLITGTMGVFTDISTRKRAEEQLLHDAFHDGLTGLANRALFMDHLRMTVERGKSRHSNPYAVLFLDFDRFKVVNDSLGHGEGDNLLKQIARRLESSTRPADLVARLGGDEFVVLLNELVEESDAVQIAERIQDKLKNPFDLSGSKVFISASTGIALSTVTHKSPEDMLRDADIAMYRAKSKGKAQFQIFDPAMHEQASKQLRLETEMRQALELKEFQVYYQPIMKIETETLVGFEALVRWKHPERGMIPPFEFIPAAEENGLIVPLGNWILQESCRQLRRWQDENPAASRLTVSVNLSCRQFLQTDLAERIAETLDASRLDPHCLKLEITESHIMENSEAAIRIMNRLRALGIELSLDDFGTGYSSLGYLHRLPVSFLKIDRSFVSRMTESKENEEIVRTIIKLAQNLKMKIVAEGIETAEQLERLKQLSCQFGQGYFFSKPLEAEAATRFINKDAKNLPSAISLPVINRELNF